MKLMKSLGLAVAVASGWIFSPVLASDANAGSCRMVEERTIQLFDYIQMLRSTIQPGEAGSGIRLRFPKTLVFGEDSQLIGTFWGGEPRALAELAAHAGEPIGAFDVSGVLDATDSSGGSVDESGCADSVGGNTVVLFTDNSDSCGLCVSLPKTYRESLADIDGPVRLIVVSVLGGGTFVPASR
ncbi:MAG TPA: hypothetical protein PKZ76_09595 [Xanthomonadaceae bacterium]|nr:hypothetical protein [Xanthomonadaceae bacterium]